LEFFLNPKIHLEYFSNVQMLGEPLGKKLCEGLVVSEKRLGIFIDQIFGASKSNWIFAFRRIGAGCGILRPTLEKYLLLGLGGTWEGGGYAVTSQGRLVKRGMLFLRKYSL